MNNIFRIIMMMSQINLNVQVVWWQWLSKGKDHALNSFLLQAIGSIYSEAICTGSVGFATWSTRDILDYLYLAYKQVTPLDTKDNDLAMQNQYNVTNLIKVLYK